MGKKRKKQYRYHKILWQVLHGQYMTKYKFFIFTYNVLKETKILDNQDLLENTHTSLELNM